MTLEEAMSRYVSLDAALVAYMEACGTPWPPSLDDVAHLTCMEPRAHRAEPGSCRGCGAADGPPSHVYGERKCCPDCDHREHKHWHQSERTLGQRLDWT
jgi:hypothetical protein